MKIHRLRSPLTGMSRRKLSSYTSSSLLKNHQQLLGFLPDYRKAISEEYALKLETSQMYYMRCVDVLENALGKDSSLLLYANLRLAHSFSMSGNYKKAESLLDVNKNSKSLIESSLGWQYLAQMRLHQGDLNGSCEAANTSLEVLRSQDPASPDGSKFHISYGLLGLCNIYQGNYSDAEENLLAALRWTHDESPIAQIIASNNLGLLSFYKEPVSLDASLRTSLSEIPMKISNRRQRWRLQQFFGSAESNIVYKTEEAAFEVTDRSDVMNDVVKACTEEALQYWDEGGTFVAMENPNDDTFPTIPSLIGEKDRLEVNGAKHSEKINSDMINKYFGSLGVSFDNNTAILGERLKNAEFSSRLSVINCNVGEALETLGNYEGMEECYGDALKIIDEFGTDYVRFTPYVARCLTLKAIMLFHAKSPVIAEGLYRSVLNYYKVLNSHSMQDLRFRYDHAVALAGYGKLLTKWVNREGEGRRFLEEAEKMLESLPKLGTAELHLSSSFTSPLVF